MGDFVGIFLLSVDCAGLFGIWDRLVAVSAKELVWHVLLFFFLHIHDAGGVSGLGNI